MNKNREILQQGGIFRAPSIIADSILYNTRYDVTTVRFNDDDHWSLPDITVANIMDIIQYNRQNRMHEMYKCRDIPLSIIQRIRDILSMITLKALYPEISSF